jgi:D-threo-aldose 1-dehydrogenase
MKTGSVRFCQTFFGYKKIKKFFIEDSKHMKYRRLGRTEIQISEVSFGGGRSGGLLIDAPIPERKLALQIAADSGINWVDTAPQYGDGASETALGELLPEFPDHFYLSTKVRVDRNSTQSFREQIRASFEGSQHRLKKSDVTLLQLHNRIAEDNDPRSVTSEDVLCPGGIADALEELRDQKLTRFIGITGLGDKDSTRKVIESGRFDTAQVYFNMLNPSASRTEMPSNWVGFDATGIFDACIKQDMGIFAIRIFAASYLASSERTGRESVLTTNTSPEEEARMSNVILKKIIPNSANPAEIALRFCLANKQISSAIIGSAQSSHVADAVTAASREPLPKELFAELENLYNNNFAF